MCHFCERYDLAKEVCSGSEHKTLFTVALVDHMITTNGPKGRTVRYDADGVGFPLKFCPECGKKLVED